MAWDIELVEIVRGLVGDLNRDNPTYTDTRLME